ncbi:MAG: hypothetical protein ACJ8G3_24000 [Burkholderiaceae bacterium]
MALSACGGGGGSTGGTGTTPTQTSGVSGKVVDGYINGATVFCDANKNGVADAGEASTVTSGQGDFSLPSACSAYLVSTGGTDVSTGYPFKGMLKSPAGAAIISPLTTLLADTGLSNAQLVKMLSLPTGTDLTMIDPAAAGNATVLKATLAAQQIVQQTANLMGKANDSSALAKVYGIVASSVASTLAASPSAILFAANGTVNTTLVTAGIQNAADSIAKDNTLKAPSLTTADIASIGSQLSQQAEAFTKASDADLSSVAQQLQDPKLPAPETAAAKAFYLSPKNDSVILNGAPYTLSQFSSPGITLAGLNTVGFEYTATAGTEVDLLADVGMAMEEVGGQGRVLQVEVQPVHVQRNATTGVVTLSLTPQTNVYVYAKDSRGNELNVTVAQPSFAPITVVDNAMTVSYTTLVEKVVGNTTYNTSSFMPSQFFNLKGNFKASFVVSSNMNVRHPDGTQFPVLSVGIANTTRSVTGPGVAGIVNIQ